MSTRAEALAERFKQTNAAAIAAVTALDDTAMRTNTRNEGWPVAFAAWHIGSSHASLMGLIQLVADGGTLPPVTAAVLDGLNATNIAEHGAVGKAEALAILQQNGGEAARAVRRLTDEQLERTGTAEVLGDEPLTVAQLIEAALIGHATRHLESITTSTHAAA